MPCSKAREVVQHMRGELEVDDSTWVWIAETITDLVLPSPEQADMETPFWGGMSGLERIQATWLFSHVKTCRECKADPPK